MTSYVRVYPEAGGGVAEDLAMSQLCGKIPLPRPYGISKGAIQEEFSDEDSYSKYYYYSRRRDVVGGYAYGKLEPASGVAGNPSGTRTLVRPRCRIAGLGIASQD